MEELFDSLKNWGCDVDGALARFIGCTAAACTRQRQIRILNFCRRRCAQGRWGVHLNVRIH